jgi:hypothetical protein
MRNIVHRAVGLDVLAQGGAEGFMLATLSMVNACVTVDSDLGVAGSFGSRRVGSAEGSLGELVFRVFRGSVRRFVGRAGVVRFVLDYLVSLVRY